MPVRRAIISPSNLFQWSIIWSSECQNDVDSRASPDWQVQFGSNFTHNVWFSPKYFRITPRTGVWEINIWYRFVLLWPGRHRYYFNYQLRRNPGNDIIFIFCRGILKYVNEVEVFQNTYRGILKYVNEVEVFWNTSRGISKSAGNNSLKFFYDLALWVVLIPKL